MSHRCSLRSFANVADWMVCHAGKALSEDELVRLLEKLAIGALGTTSAADVAADLHSFTEERQAWSCLQSPSLSVCNMLGMGHTRGCSMPQ